MSELEPAPLAVDIDESPAGLEGILVKVGGELDISNVSELRETLAEILESRPKLLVFDFSDLKFLDSSGIAVLMEAAAGCEEVRIQNVSDIVRRVLEVTGLIEVLGVERG